MVNAAGLRPPGWARCYRLAVALMLAAGRPARSLAVARGLGQRTRAGDHPRRRCEPVPVLRARPGTPLLSTLFTAVSGPAMAGKQCQDGRSGWTLRPERRWPPGCLGCSAADLRLRFTEGVVVPFLPCRWSYVNTKRRIGMRG